MIGFFFSHSATERSAPCEFFSEFANIAERQERTMEIRSIARRFVLFSSFVVLA